MSSEDEEYLECAVCWYCAIIDGKPICTAPTDEEPGSFVKPDECGFLRPRLKLQHEPIPFTVELKED